MSVAASLGAIAVLAGAGFAGRHRHLLAEADTRALSAFVYYFALPSLLLVKTADMAPSRHHAWIAVGSLAPIALVATLLVLAHVVRLLTRPRFAAAMLSVVFGSNAFFGLAFFQALYPPTRMEDPIFAATLLGIVGVSTSALLFAYATSEGHALRMLARVARSPLILAVAAGLVCSVLGWRPQAALRPFAMLGATAPPVAMVVLGMFIHDHLGGGSWRSALPYAALRLTALPLAGLAVLTLGGGPFASAREFLLLQTGVPAAVSVAILAQRHRFMVGELTGMVVLTSLASFPLLALLHLLATALGW